MTTDYRGHVHTPRMLINDDTHCDECGELLECAHGLTPTRKPEPTTMRRTVEIRHSGKMPEVDWASRDAERRARNYDDGLIDDSDR